MLKSSLSPNEPSRVVWMHREDEFEDPSVGLVDYKDIKDGDVIEILGEVEV